MSPFDPTETWAHLVLETHWVAICRTTAGREMVVTMAAQGVFLGGRMQRREFIGLIGGAAASPMPWPLAARAQQPGRMRRIGVHSRSGLAAFVAGVATNYQNWRERRVD